MKKSIEVHDSRISIIYSNLRFFSSISHLIMMKIPGIQKIYHEIRIYIYLLENPSITINLDLPAFS